MLWCPPPALFAGRAGWRTNCADLTRKHTKGGTTTICVSASGTSRARCCADAFGPLAVPVPSPTKAPANGPLPAPAPGALSASSCGDLGWTNADTFGATSVCSESDFGLGGCSGELKWLEAVAFCETAGARLCTLAELQRDEAKGTGCSMDGEQVWSSDACSGGHYAAMGSTKRTSTGCVSAAGTRRARCCADVFGDLAALSASS